MSMCDANVTENRDHQLFGYFIRINVFCVQLNVPNIYRLTAVKTY